MSFKQMMKDDLVVFYDSDEFGTSALFGSTQINVVFLDDIEVQSAKQKVVSAKSSDVYSIEIGDNIDIDGVSYKVLNFEPKDSANLELLIAIEEV